MKYQVMMQRAFHTSTPLSAKVKPATLPIGAGSEMERILKLHGMDSTNFDPKSVLPSRATASTRTCETSGRDDQ